MSPFSPPIDGNLLSTHPWGASKAADRVLASEKPWRRWLMVVQAYFDDSYSANGVHVLAGYMARAECWVAFSKRWEELLPTAFLGNSGRFRFKMNEMAHRMDDVPAFYKVISRHLPYSVTIALRERDFSKCTRPRMER